jgi:hypothetical protein
MENTMDRDMRRRAMNALHAYEALEALEDDGYSDATILRCTLFDEWLSAWEEIRPAVNRDPADYLL